MESSALNVVIAFIQPFQLESVVDALRQVEGCPGMSVSEVRGVGCTGAHPPHKGERTEVDPLEQKTRVEIFCRTADVRIIVETIRAAAHTGNPGDGSILAAHQRPDLALQDRDFLGAVHPVDLQVHRHDLDSETAA